MGLRDGETVSADLDLDLDLSLGLGRVESETRRGRDQYSAVQYEAGRPSSVPHGVYPPRVHPRYHPASALPYTLSPAGCQPVTPPAMRRSLIGYRPRPPASGLRPFSIILLDSSRTGRVGHPDIQPRVTLPIWQGVPLVESRMSLYGLPLSVPDQLSLVY